MGLIKDYEAITGNYDILAWKYGFKKNSHDYISYSKRYNISDRVIGVDVDTRKKLVEIVNFSRNVPSTYHRIQIPNEIHGETFVDWLDKNVSEAIKYGT